SSRTGKSCACSRKKKSTWKTCSWASRRGSRTEARTRMRQTLTCSACGTVLGVPKSGMPADGLTGNWCGYVTLKAPEPVAKPVAAASAAPVVPDSQVEAASTPVAVKAKTAPHRWADDEDDDGEPYAIPPGEIKTRKCEDCGK